jgi:signal transduction histidine kinase
VSRRIENERVQRILCMEILPDSTAPQKIREAFRVFPILAMREIDIGTICCNGALDRLAHAYEAERRLTADAAHQLRTPITVLDLRLQRARLGGRIDWPKIEREMAQLRHLIDRLMDLARRDNVAQAVEEPAGPQTINLARLSANLRRWSCQLPRRRIGQ